MQLGDDSGKDLDISLLRSIPDSIKYRHHDWNVLKKIGIKIRLPHGVLAFIAGHRQDHGNLERPQVFCLCHNSLISFLSDLNFRGSF